MSFCEFVSGFVHSERLQVQLVKQRIVMYRLLSPWVQVACMPHTRINQTSWDMRGHISLLGHDSRSAERQRSFVCIHHRSSSDLVRKFVAGNLRCKAMALAPVTGSWLLSQQTQNLWPRQMAPGHSRTTVLYSAHWILTILTLSHLILIYIYIRK